MTPTEEAKLIGKGKNDDNTTKNETELSRAAYAEFYHAPPPESNRNPTKIDYEDNAVKEAKYYLRVYPHDRSRFDPHIAFAEFYHVVHEVDNEALICPFDKHSTKPVLMDAHDLPNTKERLHYLYNLKERNGAWSCVVRIQTEVDDWKLLATSQMRTFLNQTGMKATKQELDSPNLAQAGWFVGLHPRLTNRKSLQHRIEKHYPEGTNIPIEIRGGEVYLPRGVGCPETPNRRMKVEALQLFCDVSHVTLLQDTMTNMMGPGKGFGQQFVRFAGWIDTYSSREIQQWVNQQNDIVRESSRQALQFVTIKGSLDEEIDMYDGEITTAKKLFEEQKEFNKQAGLLQIETKRFEDSNATVVYHKSKRHMAKANMEMLIVRLQKKLTDHSRKALFNQTYTHTLTNGTQEIDTMVKEAHQYYGERKKRAERKEAYEQKKRGKTGISKSLFTGKQTTQRSYQSVLIQKHATKMYADTANNNDNRSRSYYGASNGSSREIPEEPNNEPNYQQRTQQQGQGQYEQPDSTPPTKRAKMEEMLSKMENRLNEIGNNTSTALKRIDHLEDTLHKTVEQSLQLTEEVQTISQTVARLPEEMMKTTATAIKENEARRDDEVDKLEKQNLSILEDQKMVNREMISLAKETAKCMRRMEEFRARIDQFEERLIKQENGAPPSRIEKHHKTIKEMKQNIQLMGKELYENEDPYLTMTDSNELLKNAAGIASVMIQKGFNTFLKTVGRKALDCEDYFEDIQDNDEDIDYQPEEATSREQYMYYTRLANEMKETIQRQTQQYIKKGGQETPTLYQLTPEDEKQRDTTESGMATTTEKWEPSPNETTETDDTEDKNNSTRSSSQETTDSIAQIMANLVDSDKDMEEEPIQQMADISEEEQSPFDERTQSENRQTTTIVRARLVSPAKQTSLVKGLPETIQKTKQARRSTRLAEQNPKERN